MPRVSRWFIHASLVYLALGFTLGALLLFNKGIPKGIPLAPAPALARLLPAHVEFLLVGWVIQLVMGVATWIFPRFGVPQTAHGSDGAAWLAFGLVNAGVWLAAVGPVAAGPVNSALPLIGRLAEAVAAVVFAANVWARVRASGLSPM